MDSIVIDVHPEEKGEVLNIISKVQNNLIPLLKSKYHVEVNVPLLLEAKIGTNWLEQKEVA